MTISYHKDDMSVWSGKLINSELHYIELMALRIGNGQQKDNIIRCLEIDNDWENVYIESKLNKLIQCALYGCQGVGMGRLVRESTDRHAITKTRLFKYIENFNSKNRKFSD